MRVQSHSIFANRGRLNRDDLIYLKWAGLIRSLIVALGSISSRAACPGGNLGHGTGNNFCSGGAGSATARGKPSVKSFFRATARERFPSRASRSDGSSLLSTETRNFGGARKGLSRAPTRQRIVNRIDRRSLSGAGPSTSAPGHQLAVPRKSWGQSMGCSDRFILFQHCSGE
jgi:hypothetical protein